MTPLAAGWLLVDPAHAGLLAGLLREGARSVAGRRRLTPAETTILQAAELAAYDARSARGRADRPPPADPAPSWLSTEQASRELQVTPRHVRRLAEAGTLVGERHGRVWLVSADSVSACRNGRAA